MTHMTSSLRIKVRQDYRRTNSYRTCLYRISSFYEKEYTQLKTKQLIISFNIRAPVRVEEQELKVTTITIFVFCDSYNVVPRNSIVWKFARGYYLCYCQIFSLVPDSTECTNYFFLPMCSTLFALHKTK